MYSRTTTFWVGERPSKDEIDGKVESLIPRIKHDPKGSKADHSQSVAWHAALNMAHKQDRRKAEVFA